MKKKSNKGKLIAGITATALVVGGLGAAAYAVPKAFADPNAGKTQQEQPAVDNQQEDALVLRTQLNKALDDLETAQAQVDSLTTQKAALETQLETASSDKETLQSQLDTVNSQLSTANASVSALQTQITTLQARVAELEAQLENSSGSQQTQDNSMLINLLNQDAYFIYNLSQTDKLYLTYDSNSAEYNQLQLYLVNTTNQTCTYISQQNRRIVWSGVSDGTIFITAQIDDLGHDYPIDHLFKVSFENGNIILQEKTIPGFYEGNINIDNEGIIADRYVYDSATDSFKEITQVGCFGIEIQDDMNMMDGTSAFGSCEGSQSVSQFLINIANRDGIDLGLYDEIRLYDYEYGEVEQSLMDPFFAENFGEINYTIVDLTSNNSFDDYNVGHNCTIVFVRNEPAGQ